MSNWKKEPHWKCFSSNFQQQPSKENTNQASKWLWLSSQEYFWQPRNTLHIYVITSCLLRGFFFFGAECRGLQKLTNIRNSTLCSLKKTKNKPKQNTKKLFTLISSRFPADTLQNRHCFCAWLCILEALPKDSYKISIAFLLHHRSMRNKTCSPWKPPCQAEIPDASIHIYLHMNHLVSNKTLLVLSIMFACFHFTRGLRERQFVGLKAPNCSQWYNFT